jgi:Capsule polysaccharide biosynthesis protein
LNNPPPDRLKPGLHTLNIKSAVQRLWRKVFKPDPARQLKSLPFRVLVDGYLARLERWPLNVSQPLEPKGRVAVLVTPWLRTGVPFFNLEIGLMFVSEGFELTVLWDSTDLIGNAMVGDEIAGIAHVLGKLPPAIKVIDLSACPCEGEQRPDDEAFVQALLHLNGIWRTRGETNAAGYVARKEDCRQGILEHLRRVTGTLKTGGFEWLLIPGGIWGLSRLYVEAARRTGLAFTTYDSGAGRMFYCQDGVASHQEDLGRALELAEASYLLEAQKAERAIQLAEAEVAQRVGGGGNYFQFQIAGAKGEAIGDFNVLVPMNLSWDSAALGRERLFASVAEWVGALAAWAEQEPTARICFRQHPVERHRQWASSDRIEELIGASPLAGTRLRYVRAAEPISTYDLMRSAKVVLPFTGSMGLEAAMLGLPVITSTQCYYDQLGFVWRAESRAAYFELIAGALRGELPVSPEQRRRAATAYFLSQFCNLMPTGFSPVPLDFMKWIGLEPAQQWALPDMVDLKEALLKRQPLALIHARRVLALPPRA